MTVNRRDLLRLRGRRPAASPRPPTRRGTPARPTCCGPAARRWARSSRSASPPEPRGRRPGHRGPRPDRRSSSPVDRLSRRLRGRPAQRDGPPRPRRPSSPACSACWRLARSVHEATGGAYDVTAGALSVAWGFFKGPAARARPRSPGRRPRPHRPASPDRSTRPAAPSPSTGRASGSTWAASARAMRSDRAAGADPRPLVADAGLDPRRANRASTPSARRRASSAVAGRSRCTTRSDPSHPAGDDPPAQPGAGHLGGALPAVRGGGPRLRPHPRPPDRRAGRRPPERHRPRPDRRRGRRPLDRLLPPRPSSGRGRSSRVVPSSAPSSSCAARATGPARRPHARAGRRPTSPRSRPDAPLTQRGESPGRLATLLSRLLRRPVPDPPAHGDRLALRPRGLVQDPPGPARTPRPSPPRATCEPRPAPSPPSSARSSPTSTPSNGSTPSGSRRNGRADLKPDRRTITTSTSRRRPRPRRPARHRGQGRRLVRRPREHPQDPPVPRATSAASRGDRARPARLSFDRERAEEAKKELEPTRREFVAVIDGWAGALRDSWLKLATAEQVKAAGPLPRALDAARLDQLPRPSTACSSSASA